MGTNFYFGEAVKVHIGKRSAAGMYCWDCGVSLANSAFDNWNRKTRHGHDAVHYDGDWLKSCPICGLKPTKEKLHNSTAGRELGFNKNNPKRKSGVKTCCSFSWAMPPRMFQSLFNSTNIKIFDEYKREYTKKEFQSILSECPIKKYDSVGTEFF